MATRMFRSVILGAPASGKGTISARIVKNFEVCHIAAGDKLRQHIKEGTALGRQAGEYVKIGHLVPDDLVIQLMLDEEKKVSNKACLFDGFPRTMEQAEVFWKQCPLDLVINLVVPFDVILNRIKGRCVHLPSGRVYNADFNPPKVQGRDDVSGEELVKRDDDKPEIVQERLKQYEKLTMPLVEFYKGKKVLRDFHGRTSGEIWPQVLECLIRYIPVNVKS